MAFSDATSSKNRQLFIYFSTLTMLLYMVGPEFLMDIPTAFLLKNHLHATPAQISMFRLITGIPMYVGFGFGLVRDQWNPFGWRDRGYFRLFGPMAIVVYCAMALTRLSYSTLMVGMLLAMVSFRMMMSAYTGLIALVGQEGLLSGRLSALWGMFNNLAQIGAYFLAGYITGHLAPRGTFYVAAALVLPLCAYGFWRPGAVFNHTYDNPLARRTNFVADVKRLVKHRAVYPAMFITLLWNFMPGFNTPMQFFLSNQLHAADSVYAYFNCIYYGSFIPTAILYGLLCTSFPPRKLLWVGAIVGVPSMIPLAFIHSGAGALWMALPMGLMSGFGSAAFFDLTIRSCPAGLQGTLMMLWNAISNLAFRGSDVLGTKIYGLSPTHGFYYCVVTMTAFYALMLPTILFVPKAVIATADGEASPELDAAVLAELGAEPAVG
jgi:hypothetical protein